MNKTKWLLVGLLGLALAVGAYRFFLSGPWIGHIAAGSVAYEQGDYAKAEEEWMAALAEAEAFGPEDTRLATSLNTLALLYHFQGKYAEAEPLYERAQAIDEKTLGPGNPDLATDLINMALNYDAQCRYGEAEPFLRARAGGLYEGVGTHGCCGLGPVPSGSWTPTTVPTSCPPRVATRRQFRSPRRPWGCSQL